jgi:hypothetical protein
MLLRGRCTCRTRIPPAAATRIVPVARDKVTFTPPAISKVGRSKKPLPTTSARRDQKLASVPAKLIFYHNY